MNIGKNWRLKPDENDNLIIYHKDPIKSKWKAVTQFKPPITHRIKKKKLEKEKKKLEKEKKKKYVNLNNKKLDSVNIDSN